MLRFLSRMEMASSLLVVTRDRVVVVAAVAVVAAVVMASAAVVVENSKAVAAAVVVTVDVADLTVPRLWLQLNKKLKNGHAFCRLGCGLCSSC